MANMNHSNWKRFSYCSNTLKNYNLTQGRMTNTCKEEMIILFPIKNVYCCTIFYKYLYILRLYKNKLGKKHSF